jgi:hypothetical protein
MSTHNRDISRLSTTHPDRLQDYTRSGEPAQPSDHATRRDQLRHFGVTLEQFEANVTRDVQAHLQQKEVMKTISPQLLTDIREFANKYSELLRLNCNKISDACVQIELFRGIRQSNRASTDYYGQPSEQKATSYMQYLTSKFSEDITHNSIQETSNPTLNLTRAEALQQGTTEFTRIKQELAKTQSGETPTSEARPEVGPSTRPTEVQGHLIEQAHGRLQVYMDYAKTEKFPDNAFSMVSSNNQHFWTPDKVKEMISNWNEPRTFEELEEIFKELLQNKGKFSRETKELLSSSREKRFTDKENKFLTGMAIFTITEAEKRNLYRNNIKAMSRKSYDRDHNR